MALLQSWAMPEAMALLKKVPGPPQHPPLPPALPRHRSLHLRPTRDLAPRSPPRAPRPATALGLLRVLHTPRLRPTIRHQTRCPPYFQPHCSRHAPSRAPQSVHPQRQCQSSRPKLLLAPPLGPLLAPPLGLLPRPLQQARPLCRRPGSKPTCSSVQMQVTPQGETAASGCSLRTSSLPVPRAGPLRLLVSQTCLTASSAKLPAISAILAPAGAAQKVTSRQMQCSARAGPAAVERARCSHGAMAGATFCRLKASCATRSLSIRSFSSISSNLQRRRA
jgi:hypothetical protein